MYTFLEHLTVGHLQDIGRKIFIFKKYESDICLSQFFREGTTANHTKAANIEEGARVCAHSAAWTLNYKRASQSSKPIILRFLQSSEEMAIPKTAKPVSFGL